MSERRVDMRFAVLAPGFPVAAFAVGLLGFSGFWFLMLAVAGLGVWAWRRQQQLGEISILQRAIRGFAAYAVIGFALLVAFELGQFLGGHS